MDSHENYSSSLSSSSLEEEEEELTQQLQALQSMIPNITTRDDKRMILEETCNYLQRIHQETNRIENELSTARSETGKTANNADHDPFSSQGPKILSIEAQELMEGRFVVKMSWKRGSASAASSSSSPSSSSSCSTSGAGHVQRVIEECIDEVTMTSTMVDDRFPNAMLTTAFVKVKQGARMSEDELHGHLMNAAARFGLLP